MQQNIATESRQVRNSQSLLFQSNECWKYRHGPKLSDLFAFYNVDTIAVLSQRKDKGGVAQSKTNVWSEMSQLGDILILAFERGLYIMDVSGIPRT